MIPDADGSGESDDTAGAEGFDGADQRAEVAGILESGGEDEEGIRCGDSFGEGKAGRLNEGGDALRGFGIDGAVKDGGGEFDDGDGGGKGEAIEGAEAGIAAIFVDGGRVAADKDGAQANLAAEGFRDEVLALDADDFGDLAAAANEGSAELPDPGILATLYNADEARAIRSRGMGGF